MIRTEDPAPPLKGVLMYRKGFLVAAHFTERDSKVVRGHQGGGVILAKDPTSPLIRVPVDLQGSCQVTDIAQCVPPLLRRGEGIGVVWTEFHRPGGVQSFREGKARLTLATDDQVV